VTERMANQYMKDPLDPKFLLCVMFGVYSRYDSKADVTYL
jgi:hypothetical protein